MTDRLGDPVEDRRGLTEARNFRDLGGYPAGSGHRVRRGLLFRASNLAGISSDDEAFLMRQGFRAVCDLRGTQEQAENPSFFLAEVRRYDGCAIEPAVVSRLHALMAGGKRLDAAVVSETMVQVYEEYVRSWSGSFRTLFDVLMAGECPLLFHCSAGKDRTGIAAALVLAALGVSQVDIREDYLQSRSRWREPRNVHPSFPEEVVQVAGSVDPQYLSAALGVINREFGGLDRYLGEKLGLGRAERLHLAALYLEPLRPT